MGGGIVGAAVALAAARRALTALAREVDDSGGVRVLPAIAGIGAPWWRPEARGVIADLTAARGRGEVARAALEGIAWRVANVFEAVKERIDVQAPRVDGGLTNDPLLVSLQADAIGVPVEQVTADATSLGAAARGRRDRCLPLDCERSRARADREARRAAARCGVAPGDR
jgi:glycerol kinase